MPHKLGNLNKSDIKKGSTIVIFFIMMLSGYFVIVLPEEPIHRDEFIDKFYTDEDPNINKEELTDRTGSLNGETRSGEEDYMNLIWEKGHGSYIGNENSLTAADVDNDGIAEIIFGNDEGFIHIIQYSNGDYIDEWKSPNLGSETYGLTTGDVDNDGTIEIIVGTYYYWLYIFGYDNNINDRTFAVFK